MAVCPEEQHNSSWIICWKSCKSSIHCFEKQPAAIGIVIIYLFLVCQV